MAGPAADSLAAASLASVFVDLMLQKDDYLRALRALLREIVRVLRFDSAVNLPVFCKNLMCVDPKTESQLREFEFKERFFQAVVDLVVLAIFLGISPAVRSGHLQNYNLLLDSFFWSLLKKVGPSWKPRSPWTRLAFKNTTNRRIRRADGVPVSLKFRQHERRGFGPLFYAISSKSPVRSRVANCWK